MPAPLTPDGRYIVVRGRLWRAANPALPEAVRSALVQQLMQARRAVKAALAGAEAGTGTGTDTQALRQARAAVQAAKVGLGERGPVWWTDGAPDCSRHLVKNTPYAAWFDSLGLAQPLPEPPP